MLQNRSSDLTIETDRLIVDRELDSVLAKDGGTLSLDTYLLEQLSITYNGVTTRLEFVTAQLVVVTDAGFRLWYIDVDGIKQTTLLHMFNESEDIRVDMAGLTVSGQAFDAIGYFHPNVMHHAAAIRGDGELIGF
ncbi:hypothetical protein [Paenibacillus baekrokdamisoli]|uniref:hypothetical protein n=1 Tax=Paenibacillus baekrokdamisoli TaxID=1712516 RepID=UPI001E3677E7|nr:hypothetical protein [Paenibacillus baekrokdamisoli]